MMIDRVVGRAVSRDVLHLKKGVSTLALLCAAQSFLVSPVSAQTTPPPPSRDESTTPSDATPATAGSDKRAISTSVSIQAQGQPDGSQAAPQDVTSTADADRDEIVVTGVRQSLATAQSIKRNSDTVVDAITAQDIGALPDRSVNEALQRVPGVAISRFAAPTDSAHFSVEGSGVVIRGLSYVRGEFNGRDTFAASGGREIGFNDVPSELIGSVEVFKNLTADLIEGGIAGTVNINTRKPFDQKERLLYLSGSMNYGDMAKQGAPSVVGLFSQQWDAPGGGRFGFLASGSYSQQYSRSDSVFVSAYLPRYNDDKNGNGIQDPGEGRVVNAGTPYQATLFDTYPVPAGRNMVYVPMGGGNRTQTFDRVRIGVSAAAQYENASKSILLTAQYLRTDSRENWIEHTIEPSLSLADSLIVKPVPGTTPTYDSNGIFTSGSLYHPTGPIYGNLPGGGYGVLSQFAPDGGPIVMSNRYTQNQSVTQDFSFNAKLHPIEALHIELDAQVVKSNANSIDEDIGTTTYGGFGIDVRGSVPKVTFEPEGVNVNSYFGNANSEYFDNAMNNRTLNDGTEKAFRADAQYDFSEDSFLRKIKVGARFSDRDQTVRTNDYNNWGALSETWTSGGPVALSTAPGQTELFQYTDFYRNASTQPPATYYISDAILRDHDALTALLRTVAAEGGGTYVPLEDRPGVIDGYFEPNEIYRNVEKTWAGYVRADFGRDFGGGMSLAGNIGLRFVHTQDESFGALTFPNQTQLLGTYNTAAAFCGSVLPGNTIPAFCQLTAAQQTAAIAFSNGASFPDTAKQSFNNWLPALNVRFSLTPKLLFRFAASKAISRPNFGDLRDYTGVTPGTAANGNAVSNFGFQSSARNPYLRPVEATQFDLTAEWYFAKVGSLTATAFYKDLSHIILDNYGYTRTLTNNGQTFDVLINGPANAPGHGNVKGLELSYQQTYDFLPGFLAGFGTQATFTYVKPSHIPNGTPANPDANDAPPVDTASLYKNLPLEGLSTYNFNLSGFYDRKNIYARLAYSWRSNFLLTSRDCCFPFLPVYALAGGQMDGSIFLTIDKHFKIGVEAQNLLNSTTKTAYLLNSSGLLAPRSYFISDRQFSLTTRMTF